MESSQPLASASTSTTAPESTSAKPTTAAAAPALSERIPPPVPQLLEGHYTKTLEELKAEARAIALASGPSKRKSNTTFHYRAPLHPKQRPIARKPSAADIAAAIHAQNKRQQFPAQQRGIHTTVPATAASRKRKLPPSMAGVQQQTEIPVPKQQSTSHDTQTTERPTQRRRAPSNLPIGSILVAQTSQQQRLQSQTAEPKAKLDHGPTLARKGQTAQGRKRKGSEDDTKRRAEASTHGPTGSILQFDTDYALFVKSLVSGQGSGPNMDATASLNGDESVLAALALVDDDDDEFVIDEDEELDDDGEDEVEEGGENDDSESGEEEFTPSCQIRTHEHSVSPARRPNIAGDAGDDHDGSLPIDPVLEWESSIKEELEWLQEEDLQAAVTTLLEHPLDRTRRMKLSYQNLQHVAHENRSGGNNIAPLQSPLSPAARTSIIPVNAKLPVGITATLVDDDEQLMPLPLPDPTLQQLAAMPADPPTYEQVQRFQVLLQRHYQILVQQAVLTVRTAHEYDQRHKKKSNADALLAVPENSSLTQKDVVFSNEHASEFVNILNSSVQMLQDLEQNRKDSIRRSLLGRGGDEKRRLTRAQFLTKTQLLQEKAQDLTVFAVPGLHKLKDTFSLLDNSAVHADAPDSLLMQPKHADACKQVLEDAGAVYEEEWLPESKDVAELFTDVTEFLGSGFIAPCTPAQETMLRRHRNLLTTGEDSLILRGVNFFGEKQWDMIKDRFLPDRVSSIICRRYNKLSVILCRSFGVQIDDDGDLPLVATTYKTLDQVPDASRAKLQFLNKVDAPAVFNVHRWNIDEDVALLKAVAVLGSSWAVIRMHFLPHRDRTHLRKRYEVLARRFKTTVERVFQRDGKLFDKWAEKRQAELPPPECGAVNLAAMILRAAKVDSTVTSPTALSVAESECADEGTGLRSNTLFSRDSFTSPLRRSDHSSQGVVRGLETKATAKEYPILGAESSRSLFDKLVMDQNSLSLGRMDDGLSNFASAMSPVVRTFKSDQKPENILGSPPIDASHATLGDMPNMSNLLNPGGVESSQAMIEKLVTDHDDCGRRSHMQILGESNIDHSVIQRVHDEGLSNDSFASGLGLDMNESNGFSFLESSVSEGQHKIPKETLIKQASSRDASLRGYWTRGTKLKPRQSH